jgi:tetratricopeptide (TPR) repeat protein
VTKNRALLKRRISEWLEVTRDTRIPTGISTAAALRRARQLRREIVSGERGPTDFVVDEDFKNVLHALVGLAVEAKTNDASIEEADAIRKFIDRIPWRPDVFAEKRDLLHQLDLFQARGGLAVGGLGSSKEERLPAGDPFRRRPRTSEKADGFHRLAASQESDPETRAISRRISGAASAGLDEFGHLLSRIDLTDLQIRAALLLAVRTVGLEIAQDPARALRVARQIMERLKTSNLPETSRAESWILTLLGWSHRLAGMSYLWTGDFAKSGQHLRKAYKLIARAGGGSLSLALVEIPESQRRTFLNRPREGLALASRARRTCEVLTQEAELARAWVAEGNAYAAIGRLGAATRNYRRAITVFERLELWSNYVSALNSLGTALTRSGRFDEAKREFARALRRSSADKGTSALIRTGLAELLFREGRFADAAVVAGRAAAATASIGMVGFSLKVRLLEIESYIRAGEKGRAMERLEGFRRDVSHHNSLDAALLRQIRSAISGRSPNLERLTALRQRAEINLVERAAGIAKRKGGIP